jgi:lipid-A-disaccharide synthase
MESENLSRNISPVKKIFISTGEQSGDLHASALVSELKKQCSEFMLKFYGLGGESLQSEGVDILHHIRTLSTIGFLDVIKKYPYFKKVLKDCIGFIYKQDPDIIILVDYPGFNLKYAEQLRKFYSKKIIYYIAPQIWAWHGSRINKVRKYIDKVIVVFPFEEEFYKKNGVDAVYAGHPLVKRITRFMAENPKKKPSFGGQKVITILPGSRKDEITNHLPVLLETAVQLNRKFDVKINISKADGIDDSEFKKFKEQLKPFNLTGENVYDLILNSDLVLTKAGTSTMECALIGTPFLIFYRTNPVNYYLLKPIVKVSNLGMVNIIAKENIIKEYIQNNFTAENLVTESVKILTDDQYRRNIKHRLRNIWNILGNSDTALTASKLIKSYIC